MSTVTRNTLPDDAILPARWQVALLAPAIALFCVFWLPPMAALLRVSDSEGVIATYTAALTTSCYLDSLFSTVVLSAAVTLATLILSTIAGLFLVRRNVPDKRMITATLTFPPALPGVAVGFMVILLAGRQGLLGDVTHKLIDGKWVSAYPVDGLLLGCLYFSIPRMVLTAMAAVEKLDRSPEEAARSLGVSSWQVTRDVLVPGLAPVLIVLGAICFATSMSALGTAFMFATDIDVLSMTIYTRSILNAGIMMTAALPVVLGMVTRPVLAIARTASGSPSGAAV